MGDVRPMETNLFLQLAVGALTPKGPQRQPRAAHAHNGVVVDMVANHLVPMRLQQSDFGLHALIFTSCLLVVIVTDDYSHPRRPSLRAVVLRAVVLMPSRRNADYQADPIRRRTRVRYWPLLVWPCRRQGVAMGRFACQRMLHRHRLPSQAKLKSTSGSILRAHMLEPIAIDEGGRAAPGVADPDAA